MKTLIVSDIYGNWPALQAVLHAEMDADHILCLGNLVNYGPQPDKCVAWAMSLGSSNRVIQGNHDRAFGLGIPPQCAPLYQDLAEIMQSATSHLLAPKMKRFLAGLPPLAQFFWDHATVVAFHGKTNGGEFPHIGGQNEKWPWETDIVLVGHPDKLFVVIGHPDMLFLSISHKQVGTRWGDTVVVNPGSVGLPMDGDARAAYAVCEDGKTSFHRVAYEVGETVRAFGQLSLDNRIKEQLVEGLRTGMRSREVPALVDVCGAIHFTTSQAAA